MHPYEVATTLRQRLMERSVKLNYGALYAVVESLRKRGLIEPVQTERPGRLPERTIYQLTSAGRTDVWPGAARRAARAGPASRALSAARGWRPGARRPQRTVCGPRR